LPKVTIRPFEYTKSEYQAVTKIWDAAWPNLVGFQKHMQQDDAQRDPRFPLTRYVAECTDGIIAYGDIRKLPQEDEAGVYYISLQVLPEWRGKGIGTMLYEHLTALLKEICAHTLLTDTYEEFDDSTRFLKARNFEAFMRYPLSVLDLSCFDPDRFEGSESKMRELGIEIKSIAELIRLDGDWKEKLWKLDTQIHQDAPAPVAPIELTLEEFITRKIKSEWFMHELWMIALNGKIWVGESALESIDEKRYWTHITGVLQQYRQRGIATALKLRCIEQARKLGAKTIQTSNEENNPMYQINLRLGFKAEPTEVHYRKSLK
jgi:GNAT superfamily N-acetyltransferase